VRCGRRAGSVGRSALIVLLVIACGSPEPVPTEAPTPTPSPMPTEVPTAPPTPSPTPPPEHGHDGVIDPAGLMHDSRDLLYRTPAGAVPAGTPVRLRLRSFWHDLTGVRLRVFSANSGAEQLHDMTLAAENVSCYDEVATQQGRTCDFWEATLDNTAPDNLWYRFIASDGEATGYYADDSAALDGGRGRATPVAVDNSYALMVHEAGFEAPAWPSSAVAYQIFPDRFRNGDPANDPQTGDERYDDPVLALDWDVLPEGFCRRYSDASAQSCPWRFDDDPPSWSPTIEGPRGRDYMGGDLRGVTEQLDYLADLGVDTLYFNPIFAAGSNHRYDTRDYTQIDPYLGTQQDFDELIAETRQRGMRVILDGVFNHTSSDSPFFDRYGHYEEVGACESMDSPYREWFYMTTSRGPCVGPNGPGTANYQSWFGFDTLPILLKIREPVQEHFLTGAGQHHPPLARGRRRRLADGRLGRCLLPARLLANLSRCRARDRSRGADDQRDLAERCGAAAQRARRSLRHDDELPPARRRAGPARATAIRRQGLPRQWPGAAAIGLRGPAAVGPGGLPGSDPLHAHEPARLA
jgi:hypothetical protein